MPRRARAPVECRAIPGSRRAVMHLPEPAGCAPRPRRASAARSACGCTWLRGKCRKTKPNLLAHAVAPPRRSDARPAVPRTRSRRTRPVVTGASAGPRMWSAGVTGTRRWPSRFPCVRQPFEGVEDAVGAGIDADRREIAPEDHAFAIDDEQRAFRHAFAFAVGAVAPRHRALGLEIGEQREVQPAVLGVRL